MVASIDDMALARATAEANCYHQRSPSMMIVVPLQDREEALYGDDINASYYEFFQEEDEVDCIDHQRRRSCLDEMDSPRSVLEETPLPLMCFRADRRERRSSTAPKIDPTIIPVVTDLIDSSTISAARRSCHRRSRNRAFCQTDYERNVLPRLGKALQEYEQVAFEDAVSDRIEELLAPPLKSQQQLIKEVEF